MSVHLGKATGCLGLMMSLLAQPTFAEEPVHRPWLIDTRLYASDVTAFGARLTTEQWGLEWGAGFYIPFTHAVTADNDEHLDSDLEFALGKRFRINDEVSMVLGTGGRDFEGFLDYSVDYQVSSTLYLTSGYRFHWQDDFVNRNEFYLGFKFDFNRPPEPIPEPQEVLPKRQVSQALTLSASHNFEHGSGSLSAASLPALEKVLDDVNAGELDSVLVHLVGHTDSTGSEVFNQTLSLERAKAVKAFLVNRGVPAEQITTQGMGESQPIADNATSEGRALNRRVEVQLTATQTEADSL